MKAKIERVPITKVTLCLDEKKFTSKPQTHDIAKIMSRIATKQEEVSLYSLPTKLTLPESRTICPAIFSSTEAKDEYWASQQLFFIDIDKNLPFEKAIARCKKYAILPIFAYSTFSDDGSYTKYRLVFNHWSEVTDLRLHRILIRSLLTLFPESDQKCFDPSRKFFGGKKIIYNECLNSINAIRLIDQTCHYLTDKDKKNASKNIRSFCNKINVALDNNYPDIVQIESLPKATPADNTINGDVHKILYKAPLKIAFTISLRGQSENKGKSKKNSTHQPFCDLKNKVELDFSKIENSCRLYNEFKAGKSWLYHNELFGLATNFSHIKGGRKKFYEGLLKLTEYQDEKYGDKYSLFKDYYMNDFAKRNYHPHNCISFCRYTDSCSHHTNNIITTTQLKKGEVKILNPINPIPIDRAETILSEKLAHCLNTSKKGVYVIQAETGLGKTQEYINALNVQSIVIAVPRHDIKKQIAERFAEMGKEVIIYPDPPKASRHYGIQLKQLYALGAYEAANTYMYTHRNYEPSFREYLSGLEKVRKAKKGIIITTHDRVINDSKSFPQNTVLFDEDLMRSLIRQNHTKLADLKSLKESLNIYIEKDDAHEYMANLIVALQELERGKIYEYTYGTLPDFKKLKWGITLAPPGFLPFVAMDYIRLCYWLGA